ncbi:30S ribosomal protein S21 [Patescibacteria group bacterium]|nr:30S ribosomal protein S21 [Patescibacteria group bacterium]
MAEVNRKKGETFDALLRRFTRRVQQGGVILEVRKNRFRTSAENRNKKRRSALRRVEKKSQYEYLYKTGQLKDDRRKGNR